MKRVLRLKTLVGFFLLTVFMLMPLSASASTQIDNLYYNLNNTTNTAEVTYYRYSSDANASYVSGDLVIPETVDYNSQSYSVTSIGNWAFRNCSGLTSVTIPNSVTSIGNHTLDGCTALKVLKFEDGASVLMYSYSVEGLFYECPIETLYLGRTLSYDSSSSYGYSPFYNIKTLKNLTIGNYVTSIKDNAFRNCSGLTSVTIPNSVTSIGDYAFDGCTAIKVLKFEDGESVLSLGYGDRNSTSYIKKSLFCDCPIETLYLGRNFSYSSTYSPFNFKTLKNLTIGNSVTSIGSSAFEGCSGLTRLTIPNSVASIGAHAFDGCSGLTSIEIGNSVTSIGNYAFDGCSGLTSVTIPNSVTSIGDYAFDGCTAIKVLKFEDGESVLSLGYRTSSSSIERSLFYECPIETLYLGRNLSYSSSYSPFYYIKTLKNLTIGNFVTSIGDGAFRNCWGLTSITIGNSVTSIGDNAFDGCSGLTSLTIPNSVTSIGNHTFDGCKALTVLKFEDGESVLSLGYRTSSIESGLFYDCPIETLYLGRNLSYGYSLPTFRNFKTLKNLTIGNSVTSIGDHAFYGCSGLTSVTIPNSVTSIRGHAFDGCSSLISLTIPNSVTSIGEWAFDGCSSLTSLTIPNSVTSIGEYAFRRCNNLEEVKLMSDNSVPNLGVNTFDFLLTTNLIVLNKETTLRICHDENWNRFTNIYYSDGANLFVPVTWNGGITADDALFNNDLGCLVKLNQEVTLKAKDDLLYAIYNGQNIVSELRSEEGFTMTSEKAWVKNYIATIINDTSFAKEVHLSSAGTLFNEVGLQDIEKLETLVITGDLNGTDIMTINRMTSLKNLDISGANIVAGGQTYRDNRKTSTNEIGSYFFSDCSKLQNVVLSNSATTIASNALSATPLNNVMIGNSVTRIGESAFSGCNKLVSIVIPNSVTSIGNEAFNGCTALKVLKFEDGESVLTLGYMPSTSSSISDKGLFYDCPIETLYLGRNLSYSSDYSHGSSPFYNCKTLKNLTIGNYVTSIGDYAFGNCSGLTSITIPNSVTSIRGHAFYGCSGLTSVTIPNSVTSIGDHAFDGCSSLTSLTIPNSVSKIGISAFEDCSGLTSITIPNSVTSIGNDAFDRCSGLTKVEISDLVAWCNIDFYNNYSNPLCYAKHLFLNGVEVKDLIIPATISTIKKYTFYNCEALTSVTIPNSVTSIREYAFYGCSGLTRLTIPNSATSIGSSAFENCDGLISVTIPNSVTSINDRTFYGCNHLQSVTIPSSVISIGKRAFENCNSLTSIKIPNSVTVIGESAFLNCTALSELRLEDGSESLYVVSYSFSYCPLENLYLGRNLSNSSNVFSNKNSLKFLTIGNSVTEIGSSVFSGCNNLEELILGSKLEYIGIDGFAGCSKISKIYSLNPTPPEISTSVFKNVDKKTCQLIVTKGNLVYYWLDPVWKEFLNISDDLLYLSPIPAVKYGDAPVDLKDYEPEGYNFKYETSNSDVAKLEGSVLTIIGAGEATIGASYDTEGTPMEIMGQMRQFKVDKAPLNIGVEDVTIKSGEEIPVFNLTAEGLVYDETLEDVGELPVAFTDASPESTPGEYPIYLEGGESRNYNMNLVPGILIILASDTVNISDVLDEFFPNEIDETIRLFNLDGILVYEGPEKGLTLHEIRKGIYIIVKGNSSKKIMIK